MIKITITSSTEHYGVRYRAGDQLEVDEGTAGRLIRDGVARVDADELNRHLRGRRMTTPSAASRDFVFWRGRH
jgi:chromosome condensin MukBEF MukE localization factor